MADELDRDGFAIVRGALCAAEVERLRAQATAAIGEQGLALGNGWAIPNAAVRVRDIRWLVTHPGIVDPVRGALGSAEATFTFEADVHQDFVAGKWHKDTGEQVMPAGYFDCEAIGRDDCRVLKVGVYLQDHSAGGGLNVRPGSHRTTSLDSGEVVPVTTRPGDIVVFDVRITHRGRTASTLDKAMWASARLARADRRAATVARRRAAVGRLLGHEPRVAVYLAYGLPNERTTVFARRNHRRQQSQLRLHDDADQSAVADELLAGGVPCVRLSEG